jgi:hypothetical protein
MWGFRIMPIAFLRSWTQPAICLRAKNLAGELLGVCAVMLLVGCASSPKPNLATAFPPSAQAYIFHAQLAARPTDDYYKMLRSGMAARTIAIQPESVAWQEIKKLKVVWPSIERCESPEEVIKAVEAGGMKVVAERARKHREGLVSRRPKLLRPPMEAGALKQGLLDAYYHLAGD